MLKNVKLSALIIFVLFAVCAQAKVLVDKNGSFTRYDFFVDGVQQKNIVVEGQNFIRTTLQGVEGYEAIHYKLGLPEIPVIRFYVSGDVKITVSEEKSLPETLPLRLIPNLESLEKIQGAERKLIMDKSFSQTKAYWPNRNFDVQDAGNGEKLITLYPFKYSSGTRNYKLTTHFTVEVKSSVQKTLDDGQLDGFAFVIGDKFKDSPSVAKYINFKKLMGFNVFKLVVNQQMDDPDAIRAKLKELYSNKNLKYAFLIGDVEHVPSKKAKYCSGVTDHYYRALDDYTNDINGPDIGVGRITIKNEQELANTINKLIKYQKGIYNNETWLNSVSFIATDDRWQVAEGTHNHAIDNYMTPQGYTGIFPDANQDGGDKLYAVTYKVRDEKVVSTMNLGRAIINYSGHGGTTTWAGPRVNQSNVRSLNHEDANPFVISNACITGNFTITESFGETWIKHPQGAIMFWGSMDSSYWDEDDYMEKDMYKGIYEKEYHNFNKITQHALKELWRIYGGENRSKYYWETYVTFGDPSVRLRTWNTQQAQIDGPDTLPLGVNSTTYIITDEDGNPLKNARVGMTLDGQVIDGGMTDIDGRITLNIPTDKVGVTYKINVYGNNTRLTEKDLLISASDKPYLIVNEFSSNGENVDRVTPFQEVRIGFKVKNISRMTTSGGEVKIEKIEGPATLVSNKPAILPELGENEIFNYAGDEIVFKLEDAMNNDTVIVHFKWTTSEGETGTAKTVYKAIRGISTVATVDFGTPGNPEVGGMIPDGEGEIFITIKNTGNAPMTNINLLPQASACIASIEGGLFVESLASGEEIRVTTPIKVKLNGQCQNRDYAAFTVSGTYGTDTKINIVGEGAFIIGRYGQSSLERSLNLPIPDRGKVQYPFEVEGVDIFKDISIHLKINHTYVGDVVLTLIHPNGTRLTLRRNEGAGADNIDEIYGFGGREIKDLNKIINKEAEGQWKLELEDNGIRDHGSLRYIKVVVKGLLD